MPLYMALSGSKCDHSDVFPCFPPRHLLYTTTSRCVHNADPLTWSSTVASSAAEHAERLTAQCSSSLFHSTQEQRYGYGENLYMCWGSDSCYSHEKAMEGLCKCCFGRLLGPCRLTMSGSSEEICSRHHFHHTRRALLFL